MSTLVNFTEEKLVSFYYEKDSKLEEIEVEDEFNKVYFSEMPKYGTFRVNEEKVFYEMEHIYEAE